MCGGEHGVPLRGDRKRWGYTAHYTTLHGPNTCSPPHLTNPRKAPGADDIAGRVLRHCAGELTDVFTDVVNTLLRKAVVPTCLKATTIIPGPNKVVSSLLQRLPPGRTRYSHRHEVLTAATRASHQIYPPPHWTPTSLHIGPTVTRPKTHTSECSSSISAQHSTQSSPSSSSSN